MTLQVFILAVLSISLFFKCPCEVFKQGSLLNDTVLHRAGEPDSREIWLANAYQLQHSSRFLYPDEA